MEYIISSVIAVLIITFSSVIQEMARSYAAHLLGNRKNDVFKLKLSSYIDPYSSILIPLILYMLKLPILGGAKRNPIDYSNLKWNEWGAALVGFAGPFANFVISLAVFLIGHYTKFIYGLGGETLVFIFSTTITVNISFMLFALIPIPPMSGSYILYAIAPDFLRNFMQRIEPYGNVIYIITITTIIFAFPGLFHACVSGVLQLFQLLI